MSHDLEASYASAEIAAMFATDPSICFSSPPALSSLSSFAGREGRVQWPHADGVVSIEVATGASHTSYPVAVEFKRPNEGTHGVLTALGQSHAYLNKGYRGSVIVVPRSYPGIADTGAYIRDVLSSTSKCAAIGVFAYDSPDLSKASPFSGRLHLARKLEVDTSPVITPATAIAGTQTQWAHIREGSTEPDAYFKYLQAVKLLGGGGIDPASPSISSDISLACGRISPSSSVEKYLSSSPGDGLKDLAWRHFWFKYVLHDAMIPGWTRAPSGAFAVTGERSFLARADGKGQKQFFSGRSDSIKDKLVVGLNLGRITEREALEKLVQNYNARAHSYREDIDSGCEHLGLVYSDGRLTEAGYRFVDACERTGNANSGVPRSLFIRSALKEGQLGAFLHYIHKLSEEKFFSDPFAFTDKSAGRLVFKSQDYLIWLEDEMANNLRVIRKVSARGGVTRKPFQAELALLRGCGLVGKDFRVAVGLAVNWPELQDYLA